MNSPAKAGIAFLVAAAIVVYVLHQRCASCQERWRAWWQGR